MSDAAEISIPAPARGAPGPPFQCTVSPRGRHATWVHVTGELDILTAPELDRALRDAQLHARLVVLDATDIAFIDSAGVHVIENASEASEWGGARLFVATGPVLDRMLALTGLAARVSTFSMTESRGCGPSQPGRRP